MFKFLYDISGFNRSLTADMPIEKTAKIEKGQIVKISLGKVVNASPGSYLGVANETHTGKHDPFNPRSNGEFINVIISPRAIYSTKPPVLEFMMEGLSETTALSPTFPSYNNTDFIGGYLILLSKGNTSTNKDNIGSVREITDFVKNTLTLTLTAGGKIGVGDKYAFLPPIGFKKLEMDTACANIRLTDTTTAEFTVTGHDLKNGELHVMCRNNLLS